jgi:hypothetical protein
MDEICRFFLELLENILIPANKMSAWERGKCLHGAKKEKMNKKEQYKKSE